jgi:hypothetical protein
MCKAYQVTIWLEADRNDVVQLAEDVFIRKSTTGFCIIFVYIGDLNIIGNTRDIDEACIGLAIKLMTH